jgi:type VI secretion system protein
MREHRLLDRIRLISKRPTRRSTEDPKQMIRSVQEHLQRILNTRQGNVIIADDFGIPDFTNFMSSFTESQRALERTIRNTIQKYEPRLQNIRVSFLQERDDPLTLSFQIQARLVLPGHKDAVMFESVVDSGGHIRVKG